MFMFIFFQSIFFLVLCTMALRYSINRLKVAVQLPFIVVSSERTTAERTIFTNLHTAVLYVCKYNTVREGKIPLFTTATIAFYCTSV